MSQPRPSDDGGETVTLTVSVADLRTVLEWASEGWLTGYARDREEADATADTIDRVGAAIDYKVYR